jgi:hypothetical protein
VWKISAAYFAPNAYAYFLFGIAATAARPFHVASGPVGGYLVVFGIILASFHFSIEAASVWCWSAIGLHIYFIVQPYVVDRFVTQIKPQSAESPEWINASPSSPASSLAVP